MDATVKTWTPEQLDAWARAWLLKYNVCVTKGEHVKMCRCKTGPPMGVLLALTKSAS